MGTETKAILRKGVTIEQIEKDGYYPIGHQIPEQDEPSQPIMFQRLTDKKEVSPLVYLMCGTVIGIE